LLAGRETATFAIDGFVVGRWVCEGETFRGARQLECQKQGHPPNLRPRRLSITSNGEPIEEVELSDFGLEDPLVLFDLNTGRQKDTAESLNPNCDYALLCDTDMTVPNVLSFRKTKDRYAFFINRPLTLDTKVLCAGILCWQPQLIDRKPRRVLRASIESIKEEVITLGSEVNLAIREVPEDATKVALLVGTRQHAAIMSGGGWLTETPVRVALSLALGAERVRVRIEGPDYCQNIVPTFSLRFRGVAARRSESNAAGDYRWHLLTPTETINRADGDGKAKIFDSSLCLYEGFAPIEVGRHGSIELRDLQGWGSPLVELCEGIGESVLVPSVEDRGCVDVFVSRMLGKVFNRIYFRTPRPTANRHTVFTWTDIHAQPFAISETDIRVEKDGFVWELSRIPDCPLMAVSYQGVCIGAYWDLNHIGAILRQPISARTVALLRWLKVPLLSPQLKGVVQNAVERYPAEFLRGWFDCTSLSQAFVHRLAVQGLDAVVRALFWNVSEKNPARVREIVQALSSRLLMPSSDSIETFKRSLRFIGDICPSFAYNLARTEARTDKYQESVRGAVRELLQQESNSSADLQGALHASASTCARIAGLSKESLVTAVKSYEAYLAGGREEYQQETTLRRLGETGRGREYLIAALLLAFLERSGGWRS